MDKKTIFGLSRFELGLWIFSLLSVTASSLAIKNHDMLTMSASLIGVTSLIFIAKGYAIGQLLTIVFSVLYSVVSYRFSYYGEMITYLGMTAPIAAVTIVVWLRHPFEKGKAEVAVSHLTKGKLSAVIALGITVTVLFHFVLGVLGTANLIVSTISVLTSFIAASLLFIRVPYYAVAYAINDVVLIVLWIMASINNMVYFPVVVCFLMFLLNDLYGFINWRRIRNRQAKKST